MNPTIGRILYYYLTEADVQAIERRRDDARKNHGVLMATARGTQHHVGHSPSLGMAVPLVVTAAWKERDGPGLYVNGQALLDGTDSLWVTSVREGENPGMWSWPPRQ